MNCNRESRKQAILALLVAGLAACGGGGSGTAGDGRANGSAFGAVALLAHSPAHDAVQVPLDGAIVLTFDADMAVESFADEETWLRPAGSTSNVPGTFTRGANGRVVFRPANPLAAETDYEFQLSPLTCDLNGRILDRVVGFSFRTFDTSPPQIVAVDVVAGSQNVDRLRTFTVTFNERIDKASVTATSFFLRDVYGGRFPADHHFDGPAVTIDPRADLPGSRQLFLIVTPAVTDRAGNPLGSQFMIQFRTEADVTAPRVVGTWPESNRTGVSPLVQPVFRFNESMDPATVEAASLLFQDEFGSIVAFAIDSSPDQRCLRVRPLQPLQAHRRYTLIFLIGSAGATDVSGNGLALTQALAFTTGDDVTPPAVAASVPTTGESRTPGHVVPSVAFTEPLDPLFVGDLTAQLYVGGERWEVLVDQPAPQSIRVTPLLPLPTSTHCRLVLRGGQDGLRDLAGNVLPTDAEVAFQTSDDGGIPQVMVVPGDGAAGVPLGAAVSLVFDAAMDPATLHDGTVQLTDDLGTPVPVAWTIGPGTRTVRLAPAAAFAPQAYYRMRLQGGPAGIRRQSGNWFTSDQTVRFQTGTATDSIPPTVTATVNGIDASRRTGIVLPPSGFTIDVTATDSGSSWVDMGSVEILLSGGQGPDAAALLATATFGYGKMQAIVPAGQPLAAGDWTLTVRVRDLSGNIGAASPVAFGVAEPTSQLLPFERTQVVWVRADLDRDGNGRPDFADDMLRLGFATSGDPIGTNARMERIVLDGILAKASRLYKRGSRGEPLDAGSVPLRFTRRQPIAIPHMQIALGGLDPEGSKTRVYGAASTGVLGRAYYDYRNANPAERNTSLSPGLGVFPAEMWLYQCQLHLQVWPAFQTLFAQRFRPLCPDMGGTPVGSHSLDAIVMSPSFDYATATTQQRARWHTIMNAADDWAAVVGVVLAHEVGHSVGLVAPGPASAGLFGDASLHNSFAGAAEVMAPSVGYEAMVTLDYQFRDLDLAYLRQRVLLR